MKEFISLTILLTSIFYGSKVLDKILFTFKKAAIEKVEQGLSPLSPFAKKLTSKNEKKN